VTVPKLLLPPKLVLVFTVEAMFPRRHFPRIFFNGATAEDGRDALGWYHEKNQR
jgi:hypothetical protein